MYKICMVGHDAERLSEEKMNQTQHPKHNKLAFFCWFPSVWRLPAWRHPLYGYVITLPLVLLILLAAYMAWWQHMPITSTHINMLLLLIVTITAAIWGVGPSLFLLLVGCDLIIDLFLQPFLIGRLFPQMAAEVIDFSEGLSTALFVLTGVMISVIVHQREQARLRAQLQERVSRASQYQLEEFIGIICHELKTPLTGIQGNVQLALRKIQKRLIPATEMTPLHQPVMALVSMLHHVERSAVLETRLVNDLLDASRIQRRVFQVRRTCCNLVDSVDQAIARFEGLAARQRIVWERPSDPVLVCGDADRLEQVVSNYLSNAFKYGGKSTPVVVSLTTDEHSARVAVRDKGPGLSPQEQQRVWDRFYRGHMREEVTDDEIPHVGLGIGLSLCLAIVEQHEGQIGIESAPGEGATFWFSLPREHSCDD
jgi:signal transduction histidine kinase